MTGIAPALLAWWDTHGRKDLPWQRNPTPYRVWVSEIMLQQTQVATVERYYERFMAAFPESRALADASEDAVLHAWSGLGYYGRARQLQLAARRVRDEHGGELPMELEALLALPGIGRSTAGAILALAGGQRQPILDGNVKRVLTRLHRIGEPPVTRAVLARLWNIAERETPTDRPGAYAQAIMDLGATLCTRRRPACDRCPLASRCIARRDGIAESLPAAKPRRVRPQRASVVMLVRLGGARVLLEKRPAAGLWGGLWGLPEVGALAEVSAWCEREIGRAPVRLAVRPVLRHGFTHFDLDMTPVEVEVPEPGRVLDGGRWLWYNLHDPARVGLAAPVTKLLNSLLP
ncbi:MAG: A/G-specific adenine glycosylase [Gammaproteobacteria bacterium]|nr:A/G-specific adenine glycosylase [Gammaproteobacteria bacterium]